MSAKRIDQPHQPEPKEALPGNEGPTPPPMALLPSVSLSDSGIPGGNPGRVDVTAIMPDDIRVDPNITEGHPGYSAWRVEELQRKRARPAEQTSE